MHRKFTERIRVVHVRAYGMKFPGGSTVRRRGTLTTAPRAPETPRPCKSGWSDSMQIRPANALCPIPHGFICGIRLKYAPRTKRINRNLHFCFVPAIPSNVYGPIAALYLFVREGIQILNILGHNYKSAKYTRTNCKRNAV